MTKTSTPNDRIDKMLTHVENTTSLINQMALMDALVTLYDECSTVGLRKMQNAADFLKRYMGSVQELNDLRMGADDFETIKVIGRGAFGEVRVGRLKSTGEVFAIKLLSKYEMIKKSDTAFYWEERNVMALSDSEWITKLHYAFQDDKYLYLVMEFLPGGDLLTLMSKFDFEESSIRYYLAEMVLAVEALHSLGYVHRDLKPDNMLVDPTGHIKLADFGSCARVDAYGLVQSDTAVGTPDYISPEVLTSQGSNGIYGQECDWWAIGVIAYEMVYGDTPFYSESMLETYGKIMNHNDALDFPTDEVEISIELRSLIQSLLTDRDKRIDVAGIKSHSFFNGFSWKDIRKSTPPHVPETSSSEDTQHFDEFGEAEEEVEFFPTSRNFTGNHLPFIGYTFSYKDPKVSRPAVVSNVTSGDIEKSRELVAVARAEADAATKRAASASSEVENANAETDRMRASLATAQEKIEKKAAALNDLEAEKLALEKSVALTEIEVRDLRAKVNLAETAKADGIDESSRLKLQVDTERKLNRDLRESCDRLNSNAEIAVKELESFKTKYEAERQRSDNASASLRSETVALESAKSELDEVKTSLKATTEKMTLTLSRQSELEAKIQLLESASVKEQDSRESLNRELQTLRKNFHTLEEQYDTESNAKLAIQSTLSDLQKTFAVCEVELTQARSDVSVLSQKYEEKLQQASVDASAHEEVASVRNELENSRESLRVSTVSLAEAKAACAVLEVELADVRRSAGEHRARRDDARNALEVTRAEAKQMKEKQDKLSDKLAALVTSNSTLNSKVDALKSELETAQDNAVTFKGQVATLSKDKAVLLADIDACRREMNESSKELTSVSATLSTLKMKETAAIARADAAESSVRSLEAEKAELTNEVTTTAAQVKALEDRLSESAAAVMELEKENTNIQFSLREMEQQLASESASHATTVIEASALRETEAELRKNYNALRLESATSSEMNKKLSLSVSLLDEKLAHAITERIELVNKQSDLEALLEKEKKERMQAQERLALSVTKLSQVISAGGGVAGPTTKKKVEANAGWRDRKQEKLMKQELKTLQAQVDQVRRENQKKSASLNIAQLEIEDLSANAEALESQIQSLQTVVQKYQNEPDAVDTLKEARKISENVSASRRSLNILSSKGLESWLSVPKSKSIKEGWIRQFVALSLQNISVYATDHDRAHKLAPVAVIDVSAMYQARSVTKNELLHANSRDLPLVFQVTYDKVNTSKSNVDLNKTNAKEKVVNSHTFVNTTFHKPTFCKHCEKLLWGISNQGYQCKECHVVCHKKCVEEAGLEKCRPVAGQMLFLASSSEEKSKWLNAISHAIVSNRKLSISSTHSRADRTDDSSISSW